jgi:mono/diheme cytochrome c family protein
MQRSGIVISLIGIIFFTGCESGIPEAKMESGKKIYQAYCQSCHMENGAGVPRMNASLIGSVYVAGDKEKLISIVLHGSAALANDPGRKYQNTMPSLANLTDQEIADALTFIRNSFNNKGSVIAPGDVKLVREKKN